MNGIVVKSTGSWYLVRTSDGTVYKCRMRGKFRIQGIQSTNPISVGDRVDFEMEVRKESGLILKIHERKNYIVRKSVNLSKRVHILASNIDRAFLLVTIDNPSTSTNFIDRFLVAAAAYKIPVTLLFNKEDVLTDATALQKKQWMELYAKIGYDCKSISAKYGTNLEEIKAMMQDKVSLFSGHSGVGKSTLINALEPGLDLKTAALSEQHRQGQHTTTFAEMHALRFGGYIIDTPGIKGFGMVDFKSAEIAGFFPEFFLKSSACKFHNCLHVDEPNCAVKQALEDKTIAASRYASYLQMLEEEASPYRQDSSTHFL